MPRKLLDVSRLHALGWRHRIGLREGIESTYDWFLTHHAVARGAPSPRCPADATASWIRPRRHSRRHVLGTEAGGDQPVWRRRGPRCRGPAAFTAGGRRRTIGAKARIGTWLRRRAGSTACDAGTAPYRSAAVATLGSRQKDRELLEHAAGTRARHHPAPRQECSGAPLGNYFPDNATDDVSGDLVQLQSQRWLHDHGFEYPSVFVVRRSRGKIADALGLDAFVDDRPENCLDIAVESTAKVILVWHGDPKDIPAGAKRSEFSPCRQFLKRWPCSRNWTMSELSRA